MAIAIVTSRIIAHIRANQTQDTSTKIEVYLFDDELNNANRLQYSTASIKSFLIPSGAKKRQRREEKQTQLISSCITN